MIRNKVLAFVIFLVLCIVLFNALDYFYTTFITESAYAFSLKDDLAIPLAVSVVVGYFAFLRKKKKPKEET